MVGWLIYLGTHLIPVHSPLAIRFFFILLSTATLYIWLRIANDTPLLKNKMWLFVLFYLLNPMLGLGSIIATPDVPLVYFWSLSFLFFSNLLKEPKPRWYFLLGVSLGLGFCSKYLIVLFVLAGVLSLFLNQNYKKISLKLVFLTILSGLIFSSPVLIWNYNNEWISFLFQMKHGFGRSYYKLEWTYGYLLGQFLLVSPLLFIQLFKKPRTINGIFSLTQILFFITSTFKAVVEANWAVTAYAHAIANFLQAEVKKAIKISIIYWAVIYTVLIGLLLTPAGTKMIKNQPTSTDVVQLRPYVEKYQPLYGPNYQISSLISWDQQKLIPKLAGMSRQDFFDHLPESKPIEKTIYVLKHIDSEWPTTTQNAVIKKLDDIPNLELQLFQVSYE